MLKAIENQSIIFYGAGVEAKRNLAKWEAQGLVPVCFADRDESKHYTRFVPEEECHTNTGRYDILPLDAAIEKYPDYAIYLTVAPQNISSVTKYLLERNIPEERIRYAEQYNRSLGCNYCRQNVILQEMKNYAFALTKRITPMAGLRNFAVHLVEHCNLKCQGCNHYSPLAQEEFLDLKTFTKDFERIADLTDSNVENIYLLGGEPLLHPKLLEFIKIARTLFPATKLNLVTNGILLLKQDENFWSIFSKNNVTLCVTKYPIRLDYSKIEEAVVKYNLIIEYWRHNPDGFECKSWIFPLDLAGKQDPVTNFLKCRDANNCISLRDGKLFTCVIPPNVHHFNKYFNQNLVVCERDSIDIYKAKDIDVILNFLAKPIPFCRFCDVDGRKYDLEWKTSKKEIKEWI